MPPRSTAQRGRRALWQRCAQRWQGCMGCWRGTLPPRLCPRRRPPGGRTLWRAWWRSPRPWSACMPCLLWRGRRRQCWPCSWSSAGEKRGRGRRRGALGGSWCSACAACAPCLQASWAAARGVTWRVGAVGALPPRPTGGHLRMRWMRRSCWACPGREGRAAAERPRPPPCSLPLRAARWSCPRRRRFWQR